MNNLFWDTIQEAGKYNELENHTEPWGFTWGSENSDDLYKALATVMHHEVIDIWLNTASEVFPETPQKAIDNGEWERVWLAIYDIGELVYS